LTTTALKRGTARNPRRSEETAGKTTNYMNQDVLSTLFIRVIRGCKIRARRAHNTDGDSDTKRKRPSGQRDNTLVLFVSEQGDSFPYGGKWSLYDNGIRIAAFARWPGRIQPGSASQALLQYVDVPPTFIAAAGGDPAAIDTGCPDANGNRGFDGRSFLDVLLGRSDRLRDYVFAQHTTVGINGYQEPYPIRAVRDARYKLIRNIAPYSVSWMSRICSRSTWHALGSSIPCGHSNV
jgi:hypothetical protein